MLLPPELRRLVENRDVAIVELEEEMERVWPIGSEILVEVRNNQKTPTRATVIGYDGIDGAVNCVAVRDENKTQRFKRKKMLRIKFRWIVEE